MPAMGISWGMLPVLSRWNHLFNDKLFLNSSLIYSNYANVITLGAGDAQFQIKIIHSGFCPQENFTYLSVQKIRSNLVLKPRIIHLFRKGYSRNIVYNTRKQI